EKNNKDETVPAKNINLNNASSIFKEALAVAKKDITYFIFLNGTNLTIEDNSYLISVPHKKTQSYNKLKEKENFNKTKKILEDIVGKEINLKIELEKDPKEIQNNIDSQKSMESLLASLPREMIEINTGEQ
ncbi:MAG: hypothetical protein GYA87_05495, partial [Christensenellaceae bacterium]|nr:hypothetical protein [Christensenellaceae bacterium]